MVGKASGVSSSVGRGSDGMAGISDGGSDGVSGVGDGGGDGVSGVGDGGSVVGSNGGSNGVSSGQDSDRVKGGDPKRKGRRKKQEEEKNVVKAEEIEGYRGNKDIDSLLEFLGEGEEGDHTDPRKWQMPEGEVQDPLRAEKVQYPQMHW